MAGNEPNPYDRWVERVEFLTEQIDSMRMEHRHMQAGLTSLRQMIEKHEAEEHADFKAVTKQLVEAMDTLRKYSSVIDSIVKEREARAAFWSGVSQSVASSGAWAIIVGVTAMVWYYLKGNLK